MKKRNLITVLMMTAALAAGCGAKAETTTAAPTQALLWLYQPWHRIQQPKPRSSSKLQ